MDVEFIGVARAVLEGGVSVIRDVVVGSDREVICGVVVIGIVVVVVCVVVVV